MRIIRFHIDGRWTALNFADFFRSVNYLYSQSVIVRIAHDYFLAQNVELKSTPFSPSVRKSRGASVRRDELKRGITIVQSFFDIEFDESSDRTIGLKGIPQFHDLLEEKELLKVSSCTYASPGSIDLAGIGQSIGHLKDVVVRLIDVNAQKKEREIKNLILDEERKSAVLKNLREELAILRELGYSESEVQQMFANSKPAVEAISGLANRGLLLGVSQSQRDDV